MDREAVSRDAQAKGGPDDREVVARVVGGDAPAFGVIVERYMDRLYHASYRMLGSPEEARDVVQDTFVKAFEKLESFRGSSSLYTWLFRIAINGSLSRRRRRRAVRFTTVGGKGDAGAGTGAGWADPSAPAPEDALVAAETETLVQEALAALDDPHRVILVLRDIQQLDYREIGEVLDLPEGTVKSRLHRARLLLREHLRPLLEG